MSARAVPGTGEVAGFIVTDEAQSLTEETGHWLVASPLLLGDGKTVWVEAEARMQTCDRVRPIEFLAAGARHEIRIPELRITQAQVVARLQPGQLLFQVVKCGGGKELRFIILEATLQDVPPVPEKGG